jgi:hypothetical protein
MENPREFSASTGQARNEKPTRGSGHLCGMRLLGNEGRGPGGVTEEEHDDVS